jgi:hypothetical protein
VSRRHGLDIDPADAQTVTGAHLVHGSETRALDDTPKSARHEDDRSAWDCPQRRQVQVVEMTVAYEDGVHCDQGIGRHGGQAAPQRPHHVAKYRVCEETRACQLNQASRVAEEGEAVARLAGRFGGPHVKSTSFRRRQGRLRPMVGDGRNAPPPDMRSVRSRFARAARAQ